MLGELAIGIIVGAILYQTYELWTLGDVSKKAKKELKKAMWGFYTDVEPKLKVRE